MHTLVVLVEGTLIIALNPATLPPNVFVLCMLFLRNFLLSKMEAVRLICIRMRLRVGYPKSKMSSQ